VLGSQRTEGRCLCGRKSAPDVYRAPRGCLPLRELKPGLYAEWIPAETWLSMFTDMLCRQNSDSSGPLELIVGVQFLSDLESDRATKL